MLEIPTLSTFLFLYSSSPSLTNPETIIVHTIALLINSSPSISTPSQRARAIIDNHSPDFTWRETPMLGRFRSRPAPVNGPHDYLGQAILVDRAKTPLRAVSFNSLSHLIPGLDWTWLRLGQDLQLRSSKLQVLACASLLFV